MTATLAVLRIYLLVGDRMEGRPASETILEVARTLNALRASSRPGIAGFGRHGVVVDLLLLEVKPDRMPVTVQVLAPLTTLQALLSNLQARGLPDREVVLERPVEVSSATP
ncbi:PII-like signaling protein [Deinococcus metalli]|uniref:PII-like signaling protein n=1 Tax=Deinococcus metalli TaxID=1141878 RepID=A0A7W8KIS7_9DEIO|nr:DUF190 domain-containing protein [Deinococcus metalli]MBB5378969.1 PII-like signaling protein [Deinococcus metalli]GHF63681.1 hypothetical protein GCM10017781_44570 [Deinococcus metalli]